MKHIPSTDLHTLFHPRAIAVVGASERPDSVGRIIFENLLRSGRRLVPVHPRARTVLGHAAVSSPAALGDDIDLAVVAVGAEPAVVAAEQCAAAGVPFVILVAGGFSETGPQGAAREARLRQIPRRFSTRILGPNSLGIFVPAERLDTIFVEHGDRALAAGGAIAFVTQSGSVGVEGLGLASNAGYGMRAFVGLGNKCDLNEHDFLDYFAADDQTRCLAFYLESLDGGRCFLEQARAVVRAKPVVVLKAGRTAAGRNAVASHTGRLAGADAVVRGALAQHGIQRALDDEELCDASKVLAACPPAPGNRVALLTLAGGFGVMGADYVTGAQRGVRLEMARLAPQTMARIQQATFPFAACRNPVDLTASADDGMYGAALDALMDDPRVDIILCTAFFSPPAVSDRLIDEIARRAARRSKPIIVFSQYGPYTDLYLRRFHDAGVVGFPSIYRAVRAARTLVARKRILDQLAAEPEAEGGGRKGPADLSIIFDAWRQRLRHPDRPDEHDAKRLLAAAGIAVPAGARWDAGPCETPPGAEGPFMAKVCSPEILHKTEHGGVLRQLSAAALPEAAAELRRRFASAPVLVERQLAFEGPELIVGALVDPVLGPAVMVGAGGIFTEIFRDASFRLAPLTHAEARRMLADLRIAPVFDGFRGLRLDPDRLADLIVTVGDLAAGLKDAFTQLDLNPVVFAEGRWTVLDAKLILKEPQRS